MWQVYHGRTRLAVRRTSLLEKPFKENRFRLAGVWITTAHLADEVPHDLCSKAQDGGNDDGPQRTGHCRGNDDGRDDDDDLRQLREEMEVLYHRANNDLDYFGNPPGWVPMLSFEANLAAFENEVERGIKVLYLTYWLNKVANEVTKKVESFT